MMRANDIASVLRKLPHPDETKSVIVGFPVVSYSDNGASHATVLRFKKQDFTHANRTWTEWVLV